MDKVLAENTKTSRVATVPKGVGDAVGVSKTIKQPRNWYVAIVRNNTEKIVYERLSKQGFESYIASQMVVRSWKNGRKSKIENVLIRTMVFVKCTEAERREIVKLPYINRFMTNRAAHEEGAISAPVAVISQKEIDLLRFMLGQSDIPVTITDAPYRTGDRVRVVRGNLKGLEGEIEETRDGKTEIVIRIELLGNARLIIDSIDLEPA